MPSALLEDAEWPHQKVVHHPICQLHGDSADADTVVLVSALDPKIIFRVIKRLLDLNDYLSRGGKPLNMDGDQLTYDDEEVLAYDDTVETLGHIIKEVYDNGCSVLTGVYEPALLATWSNHPKKMAEMDDLITSYSEIHCLRDSHHALDSELPDPALALRYALVHQQHEVMPSILAVLNRCAGYQCAPIPGDVHEGQYVPERKSDPDERRARWDVLSLESYATIREHRKVMRRKVAHMCEQLSYASSRGPPIGSTASPPAALLLEFLPASYCCSAARVTLLSALELARFLATADLLQAWFTLFKRMRSLAESPPPSVCKACRRRLLSGSDVAERHYTAVWQGFISLGHELDRIMHPALIHNTAFASTSHTAT